MQLTGAGRDESGLPMIRLPTDPTLLNLTDEMIIWIFDKYKSEYPEHFTEKYYDDSYDEWENETLKELGITREEIRASSEDKLDLILEGQEYGAAIEITDSEVERF